MQSVIRAAVALNMCHTNRDLKLQYDSRQLSQVLSLSLSLSLSQ